MNISQSSVHNPLDLFAAYLMERRGMSLLATAEGFITYQFPVSGPMAGACYIQDIYISPEARRGGAGYELGARVAALARAKGIRLLYGSSQPSTGGSTTALRMMLAVGFEVIAAHEDMLILKKELKEKPETLEEAKGG